MVPLELERPTGDFCVGPAMTEAECLDALNRGMAAVGPGLDLVALGEMGIGNTTSAAAIGAALYGGPATGGPARAPASTSTAWRTRWPWSAAA